MGDSEPTARPVWLHCSAAVGGGEAFECIMQNKARNHCGEVRTLGRVL